REPWELAKQMSQFRISSFTDVAVPKQQAVGIGVIELRVCAQKLAEFFEGSLKAGLADNQVHFSTDPFYLRQAQFMDLLWSHGGGRAGPGSESVPLVAIRQLAHSDLFAAAGKV